MPLTNHHPLSWLHGLWKMGAVANRILREAQAPVILTNAEPGSLFPDRFSLQQSAFQEQVESQYDYSR